MMRPSKFGLLPCVTEERFDAFARLMRENLTRGSIALRRAYTRGYFAVAKAAEVIAEPQL